ncbi:head GIN domain-containing protein [uncultured Polaribacter sp.]|uniref:head GIN domain-containing protein n=1 Tax=uncultured Polaribacter sp. TaxID=174711 RepID=UPI00262D1FBF|nr:head GIN domain-containing protein [uncultured Polaribacter sp.]
MINKAIKTVTILFFITMLTACNAEMFNAVNGNRNVITKERRVNEKFTAIKVSAGIEVYLSQESKTIISLEADENLHDLIITSVEDGILKIYSEKSIWSAKAKKVFVAMPELDNVKATSGSAVFTESTLKTEQISIYATSGAEIQMDLDAHSIITKSTSGASIKISGATIRHNAKATSGASINAYKLKSDSVSAKATSGASINIYANNKIEASATSGGDIDFKGNPTDVSKSTNSGGSISKK